MSGLSLSSRRDSSLLAHVHWHSHMPRTTQSKSWLAVFVPATLHSTVAWAQVDANTAHAVKLVAASSHQVLHVIAGTGLAGFSIAVVLLAYQALFQPDFHWSQGKGLLIGGVFFGAAGAIATMLTRTGPG